MSHRCLASIGVVATVLAIVAPAPGVAQARTSAVDTRPRPGRRGVSPTCAGYGTSAPSRPWNAPRELSGKQLLTEKERVNWKSKQRKAA